MSTRSQALQSLPVNFLCSKVLFNNHCCPISRFKRIQLVLLHTYIVYVLILDFGIEISMFETELRFGKFFFVRSSRRIYASYSSLGIQGRGDRYYRQLADKYEFEK